MTLNELMIKHNFITKVILKDGDKEVSKDLKIKIMGMRIEMSKIRKQFEEDLQEMVKELSTEEFIELSKKENKTEEEIARMKELTNSINEEYNIYIQKRGQEQIDKVFTLSNDEFNEILEVNSGNDVEINGQKISATDFLEVLYNLFVV